MLLAGERDGLPIPGFDLGNSPGDFVPEVCHGKTLVMTTSNGTRAILGCQEADRVLITSFANLGATSHVLREERKPIHVRVRGHRGWNQPGGLRARRRDRLGADPGGEGLEADSR